MGPRCDKLARMVVSELWCYPIKACQGIKHQEIAISPTGLWLDRAWCVVDTSGNRQAKNEAISQRRLPKLASVEVRIDKSGVLCISAPGCDTLKVPILEAAYEGNEDVIVECGGMSTTSDGGWSLGFQTGKSAGPAAEKWFSDYLNTVPSDHPNGRYLLVRSLQSNVRRLDRYLGPSQVPFSASMQAQRDGFGSPFKFQRLTVTAEDSIRFQDMAPVHLANQASLDDLTQCMGVASYPVQCFRPNIVISGSPAWQEESWDRFSIGSVGFRGWKPTPRCTVPTRNPFTGDFQLPESKMLVTTTLRRHWPEKCIDEEWGEEWQGPSFGVSVGCDGTGTLRVGDNLSVDRRYAKPLPPFLPVLLLFTAIASYAIISS